MATSPVPNESSIKDATQPPSKDGAVPSGFILKLYQMVNGAPDDIISVSKNHRHLFYERESLHFIGSERRCTTSKPTIHQMHHVRKIIWLYDLMGFLWRSLYGPRPNMRMARPPKNMRFEASFFEIEASMNLSIHFAALKSLLS